MTKPAQHYWDTSSAAPWLPVDGSPGVEAATLSEDLETGAFTRLLRMAAGCDLSHLGPQRHPGPEQAYVVAGDLVDLTLDRQFRAGWYACRPTGVPHGPWRSEDGCTILEVHHRAETFDRPEMEYWDPADLGEERWEPLAPGAAQLVLSRDATSGALTRLLRLDPGYDGGPDGSQDHDFTEEVFLVAGDVHDLTRGVTSTAGAYACRPPGMSHGPWRTEGGCLVYELRGGQGLPSEPAGSAPPR